MTCTTPLPTTPATTPPVTSFPLSCYANRELSWLKFNDRVLEEACDERNPLCERLSFAAIHQSNLDEFFMVRVGSLYDRLGKNPRESKTHMTAAQQLDAILKQVRKDIAHRDEVYHSLMEQLHPYRVEVVPFERLSEKQRRYMELYFISEIQPLLAPQIVGSKQSFPFLNGKELYTIATLRGASGSERLGIIPCSSRVLHRLVPVPARGKRFVLVEDLILHFAPRVFDRYQVTGSALVRLLRNADITIDDSAQEWSTEHDYRTLMERMLRTRQRLNPIRLDSYGATNDKIIVTLCSLLNLSERYCFASKAPLDLSFLYPLRDYLKDKKELFFPHYVPQKCPALDERLPLLPQIQDHDVLLSYPYDSIEPFLRLLREAGDNPAVTSIQMTLYRVARNSQVVDALCHAAENGKAVTVLVELRARFDEENNLGWSRVLEEAGCHVIHGIQRIKIHSKLCSIALQTPDGTQFITQIGTGNYNEKTARLYTDLSLITANQDLGQEVASVFDKLCKGELVEQCTHLLVAPLCLRPRLIALIDAEIAKAKAGQPAYIGIKCNSVADKVLIDKLIEASQAGVKIQMVVRGICCLVAGVPDYTHNIEVVSIVGRYLEHSRLYLFGTGDEQQIYLSSADFMSRNTIRRVEVAAPLYDPALRARVRALFSQLFTDPAKARIQQPDGGYLRRV